MTSNTRFFATVSLKSTSNSQQIFLILQRSQSLSTHEWAHGWDSFLFFVLEMPILVALEVIHHLPLIGADSHVLRMQGAASLRHGMLLSVNPISTAIQRYWSLHYTGPFLLRACSEFNEVPHELEPATSVTRRPTCRTGPTCMLPAPCASAPSGA
jgi:hypothetical protein